MTFNGENNIKNSETIAQRLNQKKLYLSIATSWIAIVPVVAKHFIRILKILQDLPIVLDIEPWVFFEFICLSHTFIFR